MTTTTSTVEKTAKEIMFEEHGRVGYFILWLMGAPVGLLLLLWVIFGNNLFGRG